MGGNAFEGTVRMTPAEHERVKQMVIAALQDNLDDMLHVVASPELLEKSSFGDVDLYAAPHAKCSFDQVREATTHLVVATLRSPAPPVRNGRLVSFLTPERYQVDVAFTDASQLAIYATVHSNGDFARLLQVSLTKLGLRLTTEGFFLRVTGEANVSKRDASFLLSLDPAKVGEFLGLPREAFDGETSMSMSRAFELVVENRFFDGAAMAAWAGNGNKNAKLNGETRRRPMTTKFRDWWFSTGMSRYGDREPRENCEEVCALAVDFFNARSRFLEWKRKGEQMEMEAERRKECKRLLNFALIQRWYPDFSNVLIGEVLRKIRGEHGQYGSVELLDWLKGMFPEDLRNEVLAIARQLDDVQR